MKQANEKQATANDIDWLVKRAADILATERVSQPGREGGEKPLEQMAQITSDGSTRLFVRVRRGAEKLILAAPAARTETELAEANAAVTIGRHLYEKGGAVPQIHCFDVQSGMLLFEDLGDTRLYDIVSGGDNSETVSDELIRKWYRKVIDALQVLQVEGKAGFCREWCWDTPEYDQAVMLEKESGYFLRAFWRGLLGQPDIPGVQEEFADIARVAAESGAEYFLHRDCQSRNIMITGDEIHFIDFQGGRLGPLGYDLASLLIDPYVGLSHDMQAEFVAYYQQGLFDRWGLADARFRTNYQFLALQRNLQIIGAFAFLSTVRQKIFFRRFLQPALNGLLARLEDSVFADYHQLRQLVKTAHFLLMDA